MFVIESDYNSSKEYFSGISTERGMQIISWSRITDAKMFEDFCEAKVCIQNLNLRSASVVSLSEADLSRIAGEEVRFAICDERERQHKLWGEQGHPIVDPEINEKDTSSVLYNIVMSQRYGTPSVDVATAKYERLSREGKLTYMDILIEEVAEVIDARTPEEQYTELIQVAAVAAQAAESLLRKELVKR